MKTLRLLPKALADLDDIWLFVARDNPDAADALIDDFNKCFQTLCASPRIGPTCPGLAPDLRRFVLRGYVVFYSVQEKNLCVERVLHGARDIEALFE